MDRMPECPHEVKIEQTGANTKVNQRVERSAALNAEILN